MDAGMWARPGGDEGDVAAPRCPRRPLAQAHGLAAHAAPREGVELAVERALADHAQLDAVARAHRAALGPLGELDEVEYEGGLEARLLGGVGGVRELCAGQDEAEEPDQERAREEGTEDVHRCARAQKRQSARR